MNEKYGKIWAHYNMQAFYLHYKTNMTYAFISAWLTEQHYWLVKTKQANRNEINKLHKDVCRPH